MAGRFKETLGINEVVGKNANTIWKALIAEFIGNLLLNFFGCGSVATVAAVPSSFVLISLAFGLVIFVIVSSVGHVSGAHVNPAVTVAMVVTRNIGILKGVLYIVAQCLGSLAGSAILFGLTPNRIHSNGLGVNIVSPSITAEQAFGVEFMLGFVLVLTVFGVCDTNRFESKAIGPLAIGMAVCLGHLIAVDDDGTSMNPARSFGAAVIAGVWEHHWVFWAGPILGGVVAGLLYKYVFAAPQTGPVKIIERYTAVVTDENEQLGKIQTISKA
ncbi:aquaporin AQPAn.G isoform X2 [Agrilus planipennis]|uniref:Aquaporin AQPAn.G isoform X2 n=1 Tax=Agrilus planipennis TaxID=224129 RepID=A0A1W4XCG3_AGRPL|nr:aquaporin AQPAn.G isoform X2 [Agrilus planipennis]